MQEKKTKSRKKEGSKNATLEEVDNEGLDQAQGNSTSIEIDPVNSEEPKVILTELMEATDTGKQKSKKTKKP